MFTTYITRRERSGTKTFGRTIVPDSKYVFRVQVLKLFREMYLYKVKPETSSFQKKKEKRLGPHWTKQ